MWRINTLPPSQLYLPIVVELSEDSPMPTPEQILAKLYELRKEYDDDREDPHYLALHHSFLFISYQMEAFRKYVKEAAEKGGST